MLFWGTGLFDGMAGASDPVVGILFGKKVRRSDLAALQVAAGLSPPTTRAEIEPLFWQLAMARFAERQGIVLDPEFVEQLARAHLGNRFPPEREIPPAILAQVRARLVEETVLALLGASLSVSDLECYRAFLAADEERSVRYVRLSADALAFLGDADAVGEDEIRQLYETYRDVPVPSQEKEKEGEGEEGETRLGFRLEERVRFACAFLAREPILAGLEVGEITEKEILAEYEAVKDSRYRKLPVEGDAEAAYLPLEEVRAEIRKRLSERKADEKIAETLDRALGYTSDAVSFPEDLPAVSRRFAFVYHAEIGPVSRRELADLPGLGDLSGAAQVLFSAPPGQIRSARTAAGGILLEVLERIPASSRALAEVRDIVEAEARRRRLVEKLRAEAEAIVGRAEETSFETALRERIESWKDRGAPVDFELPIQTTPFFKAFDASVSGVGSAPDFRRVAFSIVPPPTEEELRRHPRPSPPEPRGSRYGTAADVTRHAIYVLTVAEARPPDPRSFAERKESIRRRQLTAFQGHLLDRFAEWMRTEGVAEWFTNTPLS